jgi:hypothetical protein
MADDKDERKRTHLRLVVDNVEKRGSRPDGGNDIIPFQELAARREEFREAFYAGLDRRQAEAYQGLEEYFADSKWPYGLDPLHGKLFVLPVGAVVPEMVDSGSGFVDEILVMVAEDGTEDGISLSLEMILPFYSDDESVMEEALLYSPMLPYGALFLEENRQDGLLDLIYRIAFPLFPPAPEQALFHRFIQVAAYELGETMRAFAEDGNG